MDQKGYLKEQLVSLRHEIEGHQVRLFWTVVMGLLGMPLLSYVTWETDTLMWLVQPFFVLVIIVLFLAQQNYMMRAGRYIREKIEAEINPTVGWEAWLESRAELRLMDKHFFSCFTIVFFGYYFFSIFAAMHRLWLEAAGDPSGLYRYWVYAAAVVYAIATIWVVATLIQHWKSSVSTSPTLAKRSAQ
jgi:hypothetical protein